MQADDFVEGQWIPTRLYDGAAPPLQPAARRPFAFDLEARAAVDQQEETGRARDNVGARAANDFAGHRSEVALAKVR